MINLRELTLSVLSLVAALCCIQSAAAQLPCDITSKVVLLDKGFDPIKYGNCDSPNCSSKSPDKFYSNIPPSAGNVADINSAFILAPSPFQSDLCTLDKVYIDTDPDVEHKPLVWGLRERARGGLTHVGINQQVLTALPANGAYTYYENFILNGLLTSRLQVRRPINPRNHDWPLPDFNYTSADEDTRAMAILAILAHEMGHVIWWERLLENQQCNYIYFYRFSGWTDYKIGHGFHDFGKDVNLRTADPPDIYQVLRDLYGQPPHPIPNLGMAARDLFQIYSGEWASLFATVSLDEDFIETYKLWTLTQAQSPLKHLFVKFPSSIAPNPVDVIDNINNNNVNLNSLNMKIKWVSTWRTNHTSCSG
jgi:hypothetical protein